MSRMVHVHHFTHGWFNPVMGFSLAFLGSLLGLGCTNRARAVPARRRRARWLVLGAISIGGVGIWLMHFMAMLGFAIPGSPVRYHPGLTALSLLIAVVTVGAGLFVIGIGRRTLPRLLAGGMLTGTGVVAMHYTGMAALRIPGRISYESNLVVASVIIAVVAATVALWFAVSLRRGGPVTAAAVIMALAISGMHYTGMAAVRVALRDSITEVGGVSPLLLIIPITVLTAGALLATSFTALQAMTQEELAGAPSPAGPATGLRH
ncbi:MAG TPA: MHYT domain-containing protein [Natronosporangium sp.]